LKATEDFRTVDTAAEASNFFDPINDATKRSMDEAYYAAGGEDHGTWVQLTGQSRSFKVTRASSAGDVARFTFHELCRKPLGRAEYAAIAESFHTIFVDQVPALTADDGVALQRFLQLVDILYDKKVMMYVQSERPAESIYTLTAASTFDQQWAWKRVSSMLHEMRFSFKVLTCSPCWSHLVLDTARSL